MVVVSERFFGGENLKYEEKYSLTINCKYIIKIGSNDEYKSDQKFDYFAKIKEEKIILSQILDCKPKKDETDSNSEEDKHSRDESKNSKQKQKQVQKKTQKHKFDSDLENEEEYKYRHSKSSNSKQRKKEELGEENQKDEEEESEASVKIKFIFDKNNKKHFQSFTIIVKNYN